MMAMLALRRGQDAAPQPISLNTLVDQYSSLAHHRLRDRGIDIRHRAGEVRCRVADHTRAGGRLSLISRAHC